MRIRNGAKLAALGALAALMTAAPMAARAEMAGGVVDCDAPGNKQVGGALLGAVIGGVAGSNLAKHERTAGTLVGATAGAAAGSYIGCRMQKSDAQHPAARTTTTRVRQASDRYDDDDRYARPRPVTYRDEDRDDDGRWTPPGLAKKPHHMPPGLAKKYYGVGERLPTSYVSQRSHYLADPPAYGLRTAPTGYRWVIVEHDAYLVRTRTGMIESVARAILG